MNEGQIAIRNVQHYLYCAHRWGLLAIDQAWAENGFVTKANLLHERVHQPLKFSGKGKKTFTSVSIYHDQPAYQLYGVTDCLEATEDKNGVPILGSSETYRLCVVEYKPTAPKGEAYHEDDLMQVFAQKICVDYVFGGDCDGVLYYADVKKRIQLPLRQHFAEYDQRLKSLLAEMRAHLAAGVIPKVPKGQRCSGCSLKDLCMPKRQMPSSTRARIQQLLED